MLAVTVIGLGLAALLYAFLLVLLVFDAWRKPALRWLLVAGAVTLLWAAALLWLIIADPAMMRWALTLDAARNATWLIFVASLLPNRSLLSMRRCFMVTAFVVVALIAGEAMLQASLVPFVSSSLVILLVVPLLGLLGIEQIFRNADLDERKSLAPLCLAVGSLFAYELFFYSHGLLLGLDPALWSTRGYIAALIVPALVLAARRHPRWQSELYVSREMVFYAATLLGAGIYMVAMAAVGYVLLARGGEWGLTFQVVFLAAAVMLLVGVLFSARWRAWLRVSLSKHFFQSRYDYRNEWLRLIATLSDQAGGTAAQRALKALRDILASQTGELWLRDDSAALYRSAVATGQPGPQVYPDANPVIEFLLQSNWIIDTEECRSDPEKYSHAFRDVAEEWLPDASVLVPLRHEGQLLGFARLDTPPGRRALNYEDHDLLKTVGRQMAVFIAQELAREQLAETRQFEAFNRMTAFLMHDLKNLMAQQALIVQNAPRLRHRQEFVDDAFRTIERSVERMRRLLEQLQRGVSDPRATRINLTPILEEVVAEAGQRRPVPSLQIDTHCEVRGDRDKLAMILSHALRNAQDATPAEGNITIRMCRSAGGEVHIEIADSGCGMEEVFVRERLFRPFDTTKGASGMGIGAYQIREYLRSIGGRVEVESAPGQGTCLRLVMPGSGAGSVEAA